VFETEEVLIWNPAVANLSLMALGSSTPEILLGYARFHHLPPWRVSGFRAAAP
jgi:hypothetical protein